MKAPKIAPTRPAQAPKAPPPTLDARRIAQLEAEVARYKESHDRLMRIVRAVNNTDHISLLDEVGEFTLLYGTGK